MQELALRLGEPAMKDETETALLHFLRSRKLEAEVVEVLSVFWIAAREHGYSPPAELAGGILKPSLLSNLFLDDLELLSRANNDDLKEVPVDFEISADFDGMQGVDLPRMFRTTLSKLEDCTGLPFVRQMAYEWAENRAAYLDVPYQADPWHFTRPLGDDFYAKLSARAALRAISAYLRTLAVAVQFWRMPPELADQNALLALPVHPSLAFLRSSRPEWFPGRTDFDGDTVAVEAALRALLDRVKAAEPDGELIAFSSPVFMSMERCVEVSFVRWSQGSGSQVDDADLAEHLKDFLHSGQLLPSVVPKPLSTTTIIAPPPPEQLVDVRSKTWPMAGMLDFSRLGYLQLDLYPSRIFLPMLAGVAKAEIVPRDGQLEVIVEDQVVADFCYWTAGWGPAHPKQLSGNCGAALISRGTAYRESLSIRDVAHRSFYLWQVCTLHRGRGGIGAFSETLATGVMFV